MGIFFGRVNLFIINEYIAISTEFGSFINKNEKSLDYKKR